MTDFQIYSNDETLLGIQSFDDGSQGARAITVESYGKLTVINLIIMEKYEFIIIEWGKSIPQLIVKKDQLKPAYLYNGLAQRGIHFNLQIPETKLSSALFNFIMEESRRDSRCIVQTGYQGWEDKMFKSSVDMEAFRQYKQQLDLPILSKEFDKNVANMSRIKEYQEYLGKIKNPED